MERIADQTRFEEEQRAARAAERDGLQKEGDSPADGSAGRKPKGLVWEVRVDSDRSARDDDITLTSSLGLLFRCLKLLFPPLDQNHKMLLHSDSGFIRESIRFSTVVASLAVLFKKRSLGEGKFSSMQQPAIGVCRGSRL